MPLSASSTPRFPDDARQVLVAIPQVGPTMVGYVEAIGLYDMESLARADAALLRLRINAYLGEPRLNTMGQDALSAMIAAARAYLNDQ